MKKSGRVALVGRPNVGKSTLTNLLVGHKVSIVSNKRQTTRTQVLGLLTTEDMQVAFLDTPGIHEPHTELGKRMNASARAALGDADLLLVVVDASQRPSDEDERIAQMIRETWKYPWKEEFPGFNGVVLCLNKMDQLKAEHVVENVAAFEKLFGTEESMLTNLLKPLNVEKLLEILLKYLPEGEFIYPEDLYTDQTLRFMTAELVREKALDLTRQEVPHALGTFVEIWEEEDHRVRIICDLICEKQGQKAILIGKGGEMLKTIGSQVRPEIEEIIGKPVFLELIVKVREEWRQNPRMLSEMELL